MVAEDFSVEERIDAPNEDAYARRITSAGWHEERTSIAVDFDESGRTITSAKELEWQHIAPVPPAVIEQLRRRVHEIGFFEVAPVHDPPADDIVIGGTTVTWTVVDGDRQHSVTIRSAPVVEVAEVEQLAEAFEDALAAAEDELG